MESVGRNDLSHQLPSFTLTSRTEWNGGIGSLGSGTVAPGGIHRLSHFWRGKDAGNVLSVNSEGDITSGEPPFGWSQVVEAGVPTILQAGPSGAASSSRDAFIVGVASPDNTGRSSPTGTKIS